MPDVATPPDQQARDRIVGDLETTLFVEAGAGTGKTTALVDRVLGLVTRGRAELEAIAAITFTDKAAAELRARIRRQLEERAIATVDRETAARCRRALDQLDSAAIGTLHSFAQRLLTEHPVEAGLPPRVEVLDEVSSTVAFERRWRIFRDELLADPDLERSILLLVESGVRMRALHSLAVTFNDNWDLVEERVRADAPEPPTVHQLAGPVLDAVDSLCKERCREPEDTLRVRLDEIAAWVARVRLIEDELALLDALGERSRPSFRAGNLGRSANFDADVTSLRKSLRAAGERVDGVRTAVVNACVERLAVAIRRFTIDSAEGRRQAGQLEFHDLLVMARALLRNPGNGRRVRTRLHSRYQRLLLDEFQDTDPIQIELAVRIAAADPAAEPAGRARWEEVPVAPGHLFLVGDPKQSIYRFRRADISTFLTAADRFGQEGSGQVELTANFRTVAPVVDWVNHTFGALMGETDHIDVPVPSQPRYIALDPTRPSPASGPAVSVLGRTDLPRSLSASDLRRAEAGDVAATVVRAIGEQWAVADRNGSWRPARLADVAILLPARTSLPYLEDALDAAGIAYRAETSSLVYVSRAVRDVLMVLRAVDDPTNHLHIVSALRTPLLACGDDDLFRFKYERNGRWSYLADQPETVPDEDPVRRGLLYLRSLYDERHWLAPSELLGRIARERRAMELGFAEGRPRDVWRRLRFVIDQARAWADATGGNLRQYLAWVGQQTAEGARVAESILPETDDDAVRMMTIHGAKGLEFPITIVSGMSTVPASPRGEPEVVFPATGAVGYKVGPGLTTSEYDAWAPIDEQMGLHERIRLLYVACTRARDHLVVSVYRKDRAKAPDPSNRTNAELLLDGMGRLVDEVPDAVEPADGIAVAVVAPTPPPPFEVWSSERTAALEQAERPTTVAATALTEDGAPDVEGEPDPGLQKRPRDLDLPPWLKGRYGTAVGRAVHGVLQTIDLATGTGLDAAVAAQCEAEAIPDRAADVRELTSGALGSPSVREAATSEHWREVYACVPVHGRLLEGYIDLLYRAPDGLVVVDYKTSNTADPAELERRVDGYRIQGASYAISVEAATDEPVARVTFVFLTPAGAVEADLPSLDATMTEVRGLVGGGGGSTTP